jgi:hypothetical protein
MATQDNQISDKRRRLFKALSAAPVVATLSPGEALANASSVQCAANIRNGTTPVTELGPLDITLEQNGWEQHGTYVKNRWAWWFTSDSRVTDDVGDLVPLSGSGIGEGDLTSGFVVVAVGDLPTQQTFSGTDGTATDTPYLATTPTPVDVTSQAHYVPGTGVLQIKNSSGDVCLRSVDPTTGDVSDGGLAGFAVIGRTIPEGSVDDRDFVIDNIYPKSVPSGTAAGDLQAMNGTCLHSFKMAGTDDHRTLTIG